MLKYITILLFTLVNLSADEYTIYKEEYSTIPLLKQAKEIKVSNKKLLYAEYNQHVKEPFTELMVYGKDYGRTNVFITYKDNSKESLWINIHRNLASIKDSIKSINSTILLEEYQDAKFMLKGAFKNKKEKEKILKILKNVNIDIEKNILDFSTIAKTPALSKIKMYMVEINNNKIDEMKSNILYSLTNNPNINIETILDKALTLSGALSAIITKVGSNYNIAHTLNILQNKQFANILDEATLTVMEGETTEFHSGRSIYIKVQGTTEEVQQ